MEERDFRLCRRSGNIVGGCLGCLGAVALGFIVLVVVVAIFAPGSGPRGLPPSPSEPSGSEDAWVPPGAASNPAGARPDPISAPVPAGVPAERRPATAGAESPEGPRVL